MSEPVTLNPEYAEALRAKVGEYRERIEDAQREANAYTAPELIAPGAKAKIAVAEALLENGSIDPDAMFEELSKRYGSRAAGTALDVIIGYNADGGQATTRGGTGLRGNRDGGERGR